MTENLTRAKGMVYGLAIKDALGGVTEFMSLQKKGVKSRLLQAIHISFENL